MDSKEEKRNMKTKLDEWGRSIILCTELNKELDGLKRLKKEAYDIFGISYDSMPKSGKISDPTYTAAELIIDKYEMQIEAVAKRINDIMEKKLYMDKIISRLSYEEEQFLYYRFAKNFRPEYVAIKMNVSRASFYRIIDRVIERLIDIEKACCKD